MSEAKTISLSVVVPCYDEARRLADFFRSFEAFHDNQASRSSLEGSEWIFVDDGSQDESFRLIDDWIKSRDFSWRLRVTKTAKNQGKGAAVRWGDSLAQGRVRAFLDADLSTSLDEIVPALEAFEASGADLMIGSRHSIGARLAEKQPWPRIFLGRLFSYFSSLFHANAFSDTQCGFKLWSASFSEEVVQKLEEKRWAFDLEMILRAEASEKKIVERPVTWCDREGSKVDPLRDGLRMLSATLGFRMKHASIGTWILAAVILAAGFSMAWRWSNDMATYALAWERVRLGHFDGLYEISRPGQGGYYYSPLFALLGAPLSALPRHALRMVYALLTLVIGLGGWIVLKRCLREAGLRLSAPAFPWIFLMLAMSNNIVGQFQTANISLWLLSFALFSLHQHLHGRPDRAAFWLALAVNFKVYPAFLLLYFASVRDFRFLACFAGWSLAFLFVPALRFGWSENIHLHLQQIQMLKAYGPQNDFGREAYQCLSALLIRLHRGGLVASLDEALLLKASQSIVIIVSGVFLWSFPPGASRASRIFTFFFLLAMMGQFSPASWVNSMGFCYFPALAALTMLLWGPNRGLQSKLPASRVRAVTLLSSLFFAGYCLTAQGVVGRTVNDRLENWSVPTYAIFCLIAAFWIAVLALKKTEGKNRESLAA